MAKSKTYKILDTFVVWKHNVSASNILVIETGLCSSVVRPLYRNYRAAGSIPAGGSIYIVAFLLIYFQ